MSINQRQYPATSGHNLWKLFPICLICVLSLWHYHARAQGEVRTQINNGDYLTLDQCIDYALKHQPAVRISQLNVAITKANNHINVSGWLPQVGVTASFVHYVEPQRTIFTDSNGTVTQTRSGVVNSLIPTLNVTQALFSPSLLYAATSAPLYTRQAVQSIDSTKIGVAAGVSTAFYDLLLTIEKIEVLKEDTIRLNKNMADAYYKFRSGVSDETDYDEAAISLNNSRASLRQAVENVRPQYAQLKQLMGYPPQQNFNVAFDTLQMSRDIILDTTEQLHFENRIEYKELQTAKEIQRSVIMYNDLSFLPSLNIYYTYNYVFQNNQLPELFRYSYPNSLIGVGLNLPLFTGFSRVEGIHKARLQYQVLDWREESLRSSIYTEYTTALAGYKNNMTNLYALRDNVELARRAYGIVDMQYRQGIVPYLNVITAESNLINSQIGYINALFDVLSSKIELKKAMGNISY